MANADLPPGTETHGVSLEELYRRELLRMVRLAYLMTGSREASEDIVQDAFMRISRRYDSIMYPSMYLRKAVTNGCRSWHRRRRLDGHRVPFQDTDITLPEDCIEFWESLAQLKGRQRLALALRFYDDLSVDDIAAAMSARPGTVKALLHRGLAALRDQVVQ